MCHLCSTQPVYEFTNKRKLCKTCYIRWFEKKVLYTIRKFGALKRGEIVGYVKEGDFRNVVLEEILKMIGRKGFVEITTGKKYDKLAIPLTINLQAYEIVDEVINGNVGNLEKKNKKIITPLMLFLDKEVELYAKLKNLKTKKIKIKDTEISKFVDNLERRHPEVRQAIVKGVLNN